MNPAIADILKHARRTLETNTDCDRLTATLTSLFEGNMPAKLAKNALAEELLRHGLDHFLDRPAARTALAQPFLKNDKTKANTFFDGFEIAFLKDPAKWKQVARLLEMDMNTHPKRVRGKLKEWLDKFRARAEELEKLLVAPAA